MPLSIHPFLMVSGIVLLVLGLMLLGLWVFIDSSLWMGTPAKARAIRLDYQVHLLPSALMMLGVGGVLVALPLWFLANVDWHRIPVPGESQVSLQHDRIERGEERAVAPEQEGQAGQIETQGGLGRAAFDIAGEWTMINKEGAVIEATFQEAGLRRQSTGRFHLTRRDPHHLGGTFSSTAAGARRSSQWTRVRGVTGSQQTPSGGRAAETHGNSKAR